MLPLLQNFCPTRDYVLFNLVIPSVIAFLVGWYTASTNSSWRRINDLSFGLIALVIGYGLFYPAYNSLICDINPDVSGLHKLILLLLLALAAGMIVGPMLGAIWRLLTRFDGKNYSAQLLIVLSIVTLFVIAPLVFSWIGSLDPDLVYKIKQATVACILIPLAIFGWIAVKSLFEE